MSLNTSLEPLLKRVGDRLWQARHANKEKMASVAKGMRINLFCRVLRKRKVQAVRVPQMMQAGPQEQISVSGGMYGF